jgi:arginyl-tRNA synthetase
MTHPLEEFICRIVKDYSQRKGLEGPQHPEFDLVVSRDPSHGDFATNVAFKLTKLARSKPSLIADELVLLIQKEMEAKKAAAFIDRVEVAGGGFINFYLSRTSLAQVLVEAHQKDREFGASRFGQDKKVLLEFVSANPTGPLTIAHGRQAAIGDSLARILQATGHEVKREYYLNDAGRQMNLLGASLWARYSEALGKPEPLPEEGYQGLYLKDIAQDLIKLKKDSLLKEKKEAAVDFCRKYAGETIMKGIRQDLASIQVDFDSYFNETSLYQKGDVDKSLCFLTDRGLLYEKDGALWFRTTDFGDDKDRVVKKSTGEYTYLAPDIAYHHQKFERGFNLLVNLLGPDHHGYIVRLKAACQALGHDPEALQILIVQLSTLFRKGEPVRMSTRAGEFVTLKELVDEVGADATRFFFVMRKIESHLDFDLDLAKEKSQENPVYYLQYAHARISSLLKFAERPVSDQANVERLTALEEADVIKLVGEYPNTLVRASETLEPYRLVEYLRELAAAFHKFYSAHRIVTDDAELTDARLLLANAARIVLRNGLSLLGISQPESM